MTDYSTNHISSALIDEIVSALQSVNHYGSVEIYVQNSTITQITIRNIKKTSVSINDSTEQQKKMKSPVVVISHVHS